LKKVSQNICRRRQSRNATTASVDVYQSVKQMSFQPAPAAACSVR